MILRALDRARHRIPFWWWLTYDALVALVIVLGIAPSDPAFLLGFAVLAIAVAIDSVEFVVKSPWARARLQGPPKAVRTAESADRSAVPGTALPISEVVERACRRGLIRDEPPPDVATVIIATPDGAVVSTEVGLKALRDLDRVSFGRVVERMVQARERVLRGESLGAESYL